MNAPKCFYSLSGRCSKFLPVISRGKNFSRTYAVISREKRSKLSSSTCSLFGVNTSPFSSVRHHQSEETKTEIRLEDVPSIYNQPVKFEDMSFSKPVAHDELLAVLSKCKTVDEQIESLAATLALSSEDIQSRIKFCKTLELLFKPFFNNFRIQMFGSTVNGFGFKGCDIDMTFETSAEQKEKIFYLERPDVPLVSEVISGKISPQEISELPYKEQLLFIHNIMLEYYKESEEPPIFINAHVPLVRFYHDRYDLKCDFTFKNKVAFANSKLLHLFAKLDKRVTPLMMTLRYWAKHAELIGKGLMFNSYTISLMIIFFLQTRTPPILPSAELILSLTNSFEIEDMNDRSFLDIREKLPPSENKQTLAELLKEFFLFYLYFDFTRVICPLTATSVARKTFFLKEEISRFRMNSICVQDPMLLSHNVAELVDFKTCRKLSSEVMVVCKLFQDGDVVNSKSSSWGLMNVFDTPKKYSLESIARSKTISFMVPLISRTNGKSLSESERTSVSSKTLFKILQDVFLFKCRPLKTETVLDLLKKQDELILEQKKAFEVLHKKRLERQKWTKKSREAINFNISSAYESEETMLEQFHKFNEENKLVSCAECEVSKNVWLGRDLVHLNTSCDTKNLLDREHLISVQTAEKNKHSDEVEKVKPSLYLYECYVPRNMPDTLLVNFKPLKKIYFNPVLGIFLKQYIPRIMSSINEDT